MRGGPLRAPLRLVINLLPVCLPMLVGSGAYTNAGVSAPLIAGLPPLAGLSSAHAHGERAGYPGRPTGLRDRGTQGGNDVMGPRTTRPPSSAHRTPHAPTNTTP